MPPFRTIVSHLLVFASTFLALSLTSQPSASAQSANDDFPDDSAMEPTPLQAPRPDGRMSALDEIIVSAMKEQDVPGAALAVTKDGKLVYAKGFGFANLRTQEAASEKTLFNLASCTKTLTAVAFLKLVTDGKVSLDAKVYEVLGQPRLPKKPDPRMYSITIRQLLHHSGGWRDNSGIAAAEDSVKAAFPNGKAPYAEAVPYVLSTPLDYAPGTEAQYSNGQFNLLKYVLECASGKKYDEYMSEMLESMGIHDMKSEHPKYLPGEAVRYRGSPPKQIPGGENMNSPVTAVTGNWLASAVDMAKFLTCLDGSRGKSIIDANAYKQLLKPLPPPMQNRKNGAHFGLGLDAVWDTPMGVAYTKNGGKSGVHSQIEHMNNGCDFVIFFNGGSSPNGGRSNPLNPSLNQVRSLLSSIRHWPSDDLFTNYP